MAINYCVNCGEKLEEGAQACTACGEPVPILASDVSGKTEILPEDLPEDAAADTGAGTDVAADDGAAVDDELAAEAELATEVKAAPESEAQTDAEAAAEPESKPGNKDAAEEDFSSFADFTGFDIIASEPAPAGQVAAPPDRTDVMAPISGMRNANEYLAPPEKKSHLGTFIKAAIGIAAVILVAAGIGLLIQPETRESIQEQLEAANSAREASSSEAAAEEPAGEEAGQAAASAGTEASTSASGAASSLAVSDAATALNEDTAFEYLTKTYDGLQSYNDRVYSCIQTYNNVIVASDRGQREAAAGIANSLLGEIEKEMKMLDMMNIGKASNLYDDYENVRQLLDDQYQRLAVIVESYDISLKYDSPYQHQTEILEPLTRDIGYSGQNTYLEHFDANYWSSRPTR